MKLNFHPSTILLTTRLNITITITIRFHSMTIRIISITLKLQVCTIRLNTMPYLLDILNLKVLHQRVSTKTTQAINCLRQSTCLFIIIIITIGINTPLTKSYIRRNQWINNQHRSTITISHQSHPCHRIKYFISIQITCKHLQNKHLVVPATVVTI